MDGQNNGDKPMSGFYNKPVKKRMGGASGAQGNGGALNGQAVAGVSNPNGIEPKKIGGGIQLVQGPVEPKVGK